MGKIVRWRCWYHSPLTRDRCGMVAAENNPASSGTPSFHHLSAAIGRLQFAHFASATASSVGHEFVTGQLRPGQRLISKSCYQHPRGPLSHGICLQGSKLTRIAVNSVRGEAARR